MTSHSAFRCHAPSCAFLFLVVSCSAVRTKHSAGGGRGSWKQMLLAVDHPSGTQASLESDTWALTQGALRLGTSFAVLSLAVYQAIIAFRQSSSFASRSRWRKANLCMTYIGIVGCLMGFGLLALSVYGTCDVFSTYVKVTSPITGWGVAGTVSCDNGEKVDLWSFTARPSELTDQRIQGIGMLPGGVPKIIHQMWKVSSTTKQHAEWVKSWNKFNPDWLHVVWTDADILALMKEKYPDTVSLYNSYPLNVMRSDMARPYILYTYGGVYVDLDYENYFPLGQALSSANVCLVDSPYKDHEEVQNSFLMSSSKHALWPILWRLFKERAPKDNENVEVLQVTGPGVLSEAMRQYEAQSKSKVCRLSYDRFMFGNSTTQPSVSKHWLDDSWLPDVVRDGVRASAVAILHVSTLCLAILVAVGCLPSRPDCRKLPD